MFRLYLVKALELTKGDTYCITIDHESRKEKKIIRFGTTANVKEEKLQYTWIFDANHENMYFYPFTDSDDSKITLTINRVNLIKSKKPVATVSFNLNEVKYEEDFEIPIAASFGPNLKSRVIIYVETYFGHLLNKLTDAQSQSKDVKFIKDKHRTLKNHNFLYVYIDQSPRSPETSNLELQIYECNKNDGGYSNLIGRTTPKKSEKKDNYQSIVIKKEVFKYPITKRGCTQIYYFNLDDIASSDEFRYIPLVRINSNPGIFLINYVIYSYNYIPPLLQNKDGIYDFTELNLTPFSPRIIQQDEVSFASEDLYTVHSCFEFRTKEDEPSKKEFVSYNIPQLKQNNQRFDDFAKSIRMQCLPDIQIYKRLIMNQSKLYTMKTISDYHDRHEPQKIRIVLSWKCDADLDLSLCALNKYLDCIGHVSFKDNDYFDNNSIKHLKPIRYENKEEGGEENVTVKLFQLPHQVKTLLVVITSYNKVPFNKLTPAPMIKFVDNTNKVDLFELMSYKLSSISSKTGLLFGALQRVTHKPWHFVPLFDYCRENKPYDAHRVFIERLKGVNTIADFIDAHQDDISE